MNKVAGQTIARTIILFLALFNQILAIYGKETIDIAENDVYQVVSLIVTIVSTVVAWWKNNSFTQPAIKADQKLKQLKQGYHSVDYGDGQEMTENLLKGDSE